MVPIYLCDDDPQIRAAIRRELEKEILIKGYDMKVAAACAGPEELLEEIQKSGRRGIYFLDVDLKHEQYTGFTLGQAIRKMDPRGFLIYVTAFGELAFETFRYQLEALDYIVKENPEEMFAGIRKCLAAVVERMQDEKEDDRAYFTVKFMDTCGIFRWMKFCFLRQEQKATASFYTGCGNGLILPEVSRNWKKVWEEDLCGCTGRIWPMSVRSNVWM